MSRSTSATHRSQYWLNADTLAYFPAPSHPVHHDKLVTELPFTVEVDLDALLGF